MNLKSNIKKCKVSTDQWFAEVYIVNIYSGISVSSIIQLRGQRDVTIIQEMKCLIVKVSCWRLPRLHWAHLCREWLIVASHLEKIPPVFGLIHSQRFHTSHRQKPSRRKFHRRSCTFMSYVADRKWHKCVYTESRKWNFCGSKGASQPCETSWGFLELGGGRAGVSQGLRELHVMLRVWVYRQSVL